MALETTTILRTVLFRIMTSESLEEAEIAVKAMCTKDDIASVKERVAEWEKMQQKKSKKA